MIDVKPLTPQLFSVNMFQVTVIELRPSAYAFIDQFCYLQAISLFFSWSLPARLTLLEHVISRPQSSEWIKSCRTISPLFVPINALSSEYLRNLATQMHASRVRISACSRLDHTTGAPD